MLVVPPAAQPATLQRAGADTLVLDLRDTADDGVDMAPLADAWRPFASAPRLAAWLPPVTSGRVEPVLPFVLACGAATVVLSGARAGADLQHLDVLLQVAEALAGVAVGSTKIIAMAGDNPAGLLSAATFAGKSERLIGLGWNVERLADAVDTPGGLGADMAATARATILLAAAAAGVSAFDTPVTAMDDSALRQTCLHARAQGFWGKFASHPEQVPIIRMAFDS